MAVDPEDVANYALHASWDVEFVSSESRPTPYLEESVFELNPTRAKRWAEAMVKQWQ